MTKHRLTFLALAWALLASHAAAAVIYQDNFGGAGGALNGTAVGPTAANWRAGSAFLDNGQVNTVVAGSANGQAAQLPFTPASGNVYTLKATILNNKSDWIAVGFLPTLPPGGDWTATNFDLRHSNNGAYAWMFTRNNATANDQEAFNGPGTGANTLIGGDLLSPANPIDFQIVLDTSAATWTAQYFLNGVQQGATFNLAAAANTAIGGVGFSRDRNATDTGGGVVSRFELSVVPEPASLGLTIVGILAAAGLTRRRQS